MTTMFESYGVPRGKIAYENDTAGDFSGFADASVFYNIDLMTVFHTYAWT